MFVLSIQHFFILAFACKEGKKKNIKMARFDESDINAFLQRATSVS